MGVEKRKKGGFNCVLVEKNNGLFVFGLRSFLLNMDKHVHVVIMDENLSIFVQKLIALFSSLFQSKNVLLFIIKTQVISILNCHPTISYDPFFCC